MSKLAANMVSGFLEFLGEEPAAEPAASDKQKDVTQGRRLVDVFHEACRAKPKPKPGELLSYETLAQTLKELGF